MTPIRRLVAALAAAVVLTALPVIAANALPAPRQLIPCAVSGAVDRTVQTGVTTTVNTDTLEFGGAGIIGQVVDGVAVFSFDNLTVQSGATLRVAGSRPAAFLARSSIIVTGTITVLPGNAGGGAGGGQFTPGAGPGGGGGSGIAGAGGGGFGAIGGDGGAVGGVAGGIGGPAYGNLLTSLQGGSGGGGASDETGGPGGGAIALVANSTINVSGVVNANGSSGAHAELGGGPGGGSGGAIVVRAPQIGGGGALQARGGSGGGATGAAGGGGGGGGRILLARNSGTLPTDVAGGLAGLPFGEGGSTGTVTTTGYKLKKTQSLPAVVRSSTQWHLNPALADGESTTPEFTYGTRPLVPFMGDWDGDGVRTAGYFNAGVFHLRSSNAATATEQTFTFGDSRGFVVVGDWNGDGLDDVAVYRNGTWQSRLTGCETTATFTFGAGSWPAVVPVAGDWDGDGISGIGLYTPATGIWSIRSTPTAGTSQGDFLFPGTSGYYPVTGDWNGDGTDRFGVKSTAGATWFLRNALASGTITGADTSFNFGLATDLPQVWSVLAP